MWNPFKMRRAQKKWQAINSLLGWNVQEFYKKGALYHAREKNLYDAPRGYFHSWRGGADHSVETLSQMLFANNSRQGRALAQGRQLGKI
jgi:hypothetical protein